MKEMWEKAKKIGPGKIAVVFLAGAFLLLLTFSEREQTPSLSLPDMDETQEEGEEQYYEKRMKDVLEHTEGIGEVIVMLSPDGDGIVVVAEGAGDAKAVLEIVQTAEVLFGIPAHKVKVLPMKAKSR